MRSPLSLPKVLKTKRPPECHILVGTNDVLVRYAEDLLGLQAQHVTSFMEEDVKPGLWRVDTEPALGFPVDAPPPKVALWDVSPVLAAKSPILKEVVAAGFEAAGVKPTPEALETVQYKLLEGSAEVQDIHRAIMEASQWAQLPLPPRSELPWNNPEGYFRLPRVSREVRMYRASLLGTPQVQKRPLDLSRLTPPPPETLLDSTETVLQGWEQGWMEDVTARVLLRYMWGSVYPKKPRKNSSRSR